MIHRLRERLGPVDRTIALWTAGVLVALGLNVGFLAVNLGALIMNQAAVRQSHTVLTELATLFSLLQDAENGQRGFAITGDDAFLEPYLRARRDLDVARARLTAAFEARGIGEPYTQTMGALIDQRMDLLQTSIDARRAEGFSAAREQNSANQGKELMDQIRTLVGQLTTSENRHLSLLTADAERTTRNTLLTFGFATAVSVGLLMVVGYVVNRTSDARRRREAAQELLADSGAALAAALDERTTFEVLARTAVPTFADLCAVDVLDDDGVLRRAVTFATDQEQQELFAQLAASYLQPEQGPEWSREVLRQSQGVVFHDLYQRATTSLPAAYLALNPRAAIMVPLLARGRAVGAALFMTTTSGRRYTDDDLKTAEELARRTAIAADNARLFATTQQAVRVRDQFLSIASHELKTPLTALLGNATLFQRRALRDGTLSERDQRALRVVVDQGQRLNRLIGILLDVSRMDLGQFSVQRQPLDLRDVIQRVVDEFEPSLDHHTLEVQLPDEPLPVLGDELRLDQVLRNLVQNALKYSPDGGPITVEVSAADGSAVIAVQDQGIGIAPHVIPDLFERFYRAPNANANDVSGLGIGLYVVREIVRLHEGTIRAESAGRGSRFTVQLPLHTGDVPGTLSASSSEGTATQPTNTKRGARQ